MAIFVLIFCILAHCSSFGAAEKPITPPPKNQQQIDQLRTQFNNNFSALEKEVQAEHFPYVSIKKRKEEINKVIFKMRFLDKDLSKELVAQREEINKKIAEGTKKAIEKSLKSAQDKITKIDDVSLLTPRAISQSLTTIDLALTRVDSVRTLIQENLVENQSPYVSGIKQFIQNVNTKLNSIMAGMNQKSSDPDMQSQFEHLKKLTEALKTFQTKMNEITGPTDQILIASFEDELKLLNQNLNRNTEFTQAAQALDNYFPKERTTIGLDLKTIKDLMKLFDNYLAQFQHVAQGFEAPQSTDDLARQKILIGQKEEFEQRIHHVLFKSIELRIKEINDRLLKFARLDAAHKYQEMRPLPEFMMHKLSDQTKKELFTNKAPIDNQTEWQIITQDTEEIKQLYYKYYEHLGSMTICPTDRRSLEDAYRGMSSFVKGILFSLESTIKDIPVGEYALISQNDYEVLSTYPKMYGRILNQYEEITHILGAMNIVRFDPKKDSFQPFKKVHKEIGDIADKLEQVYTAAHQGYNQAAAAASAQAQSEAATGSGAKRKTTGLSAAQGAPAKQEPPAKKARAEDKPQAQYPAAAGAGAGHAPLEQQSLLPAMKNIANKAAAAAAQAAPEEDMPALEPETPRNKPAAGAGAAAYQEGDPDQKPTTAAACGFEPVSDAFF